jgi:hypothetical protein
MKTLQMAFD